MTPVNCRNCQHYHITWDRTRPHGCRALGFKSAHLPALEVMRLSGAGCLQFQPKPTTKPQ